MASRTALERPRWRQRFLWLMLALCLSTASASPFRRSSARSIGRRQPFLVSKDAFGSLPSRVGVVDSSTDRISLCRASSRLDQALRRIPRGGASLDEEDESEDEWSDEEDEDEFLFDLEDGDFGDSAMAESDFAEDSTLDRILDAWSKTPPLTKAYLSASCAATVYGYLFCQNQFPPLLSLEWKPILTRLQVWRLVTAFLNFGPLGLGYLMTAHFVWTYMSTLERLNHNRPYDFWILILFGQVSMVIGYPVLRLSPRFLGHNLSTFLVYIWSRYHEGIEVNMFELFNTRAELLPWFFLAQTFLLEGEVPVLDFLGIVFGHLYHHCKTVGLLRAPSALVEWYDKSDSFLAKTLREKYKPISSDFEMVQ